MWPSLALALPVFLVGLLVYITFALFMAFFRATYLDFWGVVLCVAMMSISGLFYIIGGQYAGQQAVAPGADLGLRPAASMRCKFLVLPVLDRRDRRHRRRSARWYRTLFLEEMSRDYVRTARAKGLAERACCSGTCSRTP